ncbi:Fic family protein [Leptospira koniambonensis]|uniref:Fic family protein n=1 Tax=Leptospira koniambonensis TaxID=2484950 RepID=UPI003EC0C716
MKSQIDAFRPIPAETMDRIMRKFRLDWDFHSNSIEGNSLTFGETKAFLMHGLTANGKPLKDHLDIKGHHEAILALEDFIREDKVLSEFIIRSFHQLLLVEPYEMEALDENGEIVVRKFVPGEYKRLPNHVKTVTGEILYFTDPLKVRDEMQSLLAWYERETAEKRLHPLIFAATFHHLFIKIHPFDDGNGRLARILMNLILMKNGLLPVIIQAQDKANYLRALRQADGGEIEPFVEYVGIQLIKSLETMLKGAKGESIDDADDLDKKIQLLLSGVDKGKINIAGTRRNGIAMTFILHDFILPIVDDLTKSMKKFDSLFNEVKYEIAWTEVSGISSFHSDIRFFKKEIENWKEREITLLSYKGILNGYKHSTENFGSFFSWLTFYFNEYNYEVRLSEGQKNWKSSYDSVLSEKDQKEITTEFGNILFEKVEKSVSKK